DASAGPPTWATSLAGNSLSSVDISTASRVFVGSKVGNATQFVANAADGATLTFTSVSTSPNNSPVNAVLAFNASTVYTGLYTSGVFKSADTGATFSPTSLAIAQGLVVDNVSANKVL